MRGAARLIAAATVSLMALSAASAQVAASGASGNDAASDGLGLDDIVVTAQKREQSRQDVPISIAVFGANAIAALGAESIGDLDTFTPGLSINDTSVTQPSYTIRGVATDDFGMAPSHRSASSLMGSTRRGRAAP